MKKIKILLILLVVTLISSNMFCLPVEAASNKKVTTSNKKALKSKKSKKKSKKTYKYDDLQNLFLSITDQTTIDDIEKYISEKKLSYTSEEYNASSSKEKKLTYKIAYKDSAALQKYADEGSNVEITFNKNDNDTILFAQYEMEGKCSYRALYYNYGTWFDFREEEPGKYTGYYIVDSFGKDEGIEIEYSNGNKTKTNYFKQKSAKKAIQKVIDHE